MRLSGRIAAAAEIIDDLKVRRRPVSVALRDWAASHRFAGSKDRSAIGNLVYDVERKRSSHAYAMQSDSGRALILSVVVRDWGASVDQLQSDFAANKFAPDAISEKETERLEAASPLRDAPGQIAANVPEWLVPSLKQAFGDDWQREAEALSMRPPLDMRINGLKASRDKVLKSLRRFDPQPSQISPIGLRIPSSDGDVRTPNVQVDEAYQKGWIEVQDEGSQLVSLLSGATEQDQVLDLCAGGGGKTLALAAMMQNKGQIFAHDADANRLAPIYDRLNRAGVRNTQVRKPEPGSLTDLEGQMSIVLVDAPCTGTGTWRRHPDTKWRLTPTQLEKRMSEQAKVLDQAAKFARPGGSIVYVTCSILPEENQQQIEKFIAANGIFVSSGLKPVWDEKFPDAANSVWEIGPGLQLTPAQTGTDGFYVAILQKTG